MRLRRRREVLVGSSIIDVRRLPKILESTIESRDAAWRDAKATQIRLEALRSQLAVWDAKHGVCADVPEAACRIREIMGWSA